MALVSAKSQNLLSANTKVISQDVHSLSDLSVSWGPYTGASKALAFLIRVFQDQGQRVVWSYSQHLLTDERYVSPNDLGSAQGLQGISFLLNIRMKEGEDFFVTEEESGPSEVLPLKNQLCTLVSPKILIYSISSFQSSLQRDSPSRCMTLTWLWYPRDEPEFTQFFFSTRANFFWEGFYWFTLSPTSEFTTELSILTGSSIIAMSPVVPI